MRRCNYVSELCRFICSLSTLTPRHAFWQECNFSSMAALACPMGPWYGPSAFAEGSQHAPCATRGEQWCLNLFLRIPNQGSILGIMGLHCTYSPTMAVYIYIEREIERWIYTYSFVCIICMRMYLYMCTYVYIRIHVCILYICMYIYIDTQLGAHAWGT